MTEQEETDENEATMRAAAQAIEEYFNGCYGPGMRFVIMAVDPVENQTANVISNCTATDLVDVLHSQLDRAVANAGMMPRLT